MHPPREHHSPTIELPPPARLSLEQYSKIVNTGVFEGGPKVELIEGVLREMSPASEPHAGCIRRLLRLFSTTFAGAATIAVQDGVEIAPNSVPEPDVAILKYRADDYFHRRPRAEEVLLLVEVAVSSLEYDLDIKKRLYAEAEIPEYWVIDLQNRRLIVHREPTGGDYRVRRLLVPEESVDFSIGEQRFESVVATLVGKASA